MSQTIARWWIGCHRRGPAIGAGSRSWGLASVFDSQVDNEEQSAIIFLTISCVNLPRIGFVRQTALALATQSCRQWHPTPLTVLKK